MKTAQDETPIEDIKIYVVSGTVKYGMRGKDVETVQKRLSYYNYLKSDDIDGIFLRVTENALKRFQQDHDLVADGKAGVRTLSKLGIEVEQPPVVIKDPNNYEFGSREWNEANFNNLEYDKGFEAVIENAAKRCIANRARYQNVIDLMGINVIKTSHNIEPWMFVACLHNMEASGNFAGVLHNGEKIIGTGKVTTLVPKGRGPFKNWEQSAIDVFTLKNLNKMTDFSVGNFLYQTERFNGLGYFNKKLISPYNFAQSNIARDTGKYVADGKYSSIANANGQTGVATLLKEILKQMFGEIETPKNTDFTLVDKITSQYTFLTPRMVRLAVQHLENPLIKNKDIMSIVDLRVNDKFARHYIFDTKTGSMLHRLKVAHGKNSDPNKDGYATEFSNVHGSFKTSLGAYLVGNLYKGKFRISRYMYGLEDGVNDNAFARAIRWHDTDYVNDTEGSPSGDSLGCFANSYPTTQQIKHLLQDTLLYAYYNQ